jgi:anti-sigma factor RsiW
MPACADKELLICALVDGELDAANTALIEAHVARCDDCREELERFEAIRALTRSEGVRHSAPATLTRRIAELPELAPVRSGARWLPGWLAPGVVGALAATLAFVAFVPPSSQSIVDEQLVSSHVRSLQPGHLTDVQTTNQHIVKPWFNGRITFSPPVPELAEQGFPLIGGRLDSVDGKTVPAIVYKRRLHTVNVFVWPQESAGERSFSKDGFNVIEWSSNGLRFAAISDIPASELGQFEQLFRQRAG